ncbi:unnamed protein product [Zymoseptoria tritici ST99CH_3D1]|uniref:Secreted protein n=1 Tax=Zymoseptoria tritici (strain ST99CH_3D7) TaxID=1276538 RepID=A0A1X7RUW5_ZYMT9|nr:unnamed protein product [Zymoseptoria tritici ST99CH_3D7]SMR54435.1 unnamed protein product [Zymoseptoria tritici ST99CH_3D1]
MQLSLVCALMGVVSIAVGAPVEKLPVGVDSYSTRSAWHRPPISGHAEVEGEDDAVKRAAEAEEATIDCYSTRSRWANVKRACGHPPSEE